MTSQSASILVTGPNRAARAFLSDNLTADGHDLLTAPTVASAWQLLCASRIDLVLVDVSDVSRFDRSGLELVGRIRQSARTGTSVDASVPVVVLGPRLGEVDRLRIFDCGCDDLVQHPYSYAELRARIGALLRRSHGDWGTSRLQIGPLEVDPTSRQAWLDAEPVALSAKEFAVLALLASEPSRVFSRAELLERVWGFAAGDRTRTVDVHVSRLRRKLEHPRERFVLNAWGQGYKLVSAVSLAATEPRPSVVPLATSRLGREDWREQRAA